MKGKNDPAIELLPGATATGHLSRPPRQPSVVCSSKVGIESTSRKHANSKVNPTIADLYERGSGAGRSS